MRTVFRCVLVGLLVGSALHPVHAAAGQPRPRRTPVDYAATAPIAQGPVERYLLNPFGEVEGLLLQGGMQVKFPPHLAEALTAAVKPGNTVSVQGAPESRTAVKAAVITNSATNQQVVNQPPDPQRRRMPPHLRGAGLKPLTAQGEVKYLLTGKHGETNGVILTDGSIVRVAPRVAVQFGALLQPGQRLAASGYGSENQFGRALEATALGPAGGALQPLYGSRP